MVYFVDSNGNIYSHPVEDSDSCSVTFSPIKFVGQGGPGDYDFSTTITISCPQSRSIKSQAHLYGYVGNNNVNQYSATSYCQGMGPCNATVHYYNYEPCGDGEEINLHSDSTASSYVTSKGRTVGLSAIPGPHLSGVLVNDC